MRLKVMAFSAAGLIIGMIVAVAVIPGAIDFLSQRPKTWTTGKADIGGSFTMIDHNGREVTDKTFRGDYLLVFFGFTYCPDVCPAALQTVTAAMKRLGPKTQRLQPIFVSVDPDRDKPAVLKEYLSHFDNKIVGLTGTDAQVADMVKTYRAYAKKAPTGEEANDYTMNHSAFIYFMDDEGSFITHFSPVTSFEKMAERIAKEIQ